jgi:hypothetical protein
MHALKMLLIFSGYFCGQTNEDRFGRSCSNNVAKILQGLQDSAERGGR